MIHFRSFFSLIELMVVIAIISILASLLLPSINRAKEAAWGVRCVANWKQLGMTIHEFADEHNGRHPGNARRLSPSASNEPANVFANGWLRDAYGKRMYNMSSTESWAYSDWDCPKIIGKHHLNYLNSGTNYVNMGMNRWLTGYHAKNHGSSPDTGVIDASLYPSAYASNYDYWLGARLRLVSNPSDFVAALDWTNSSTGWWKRTGFAQGQSSNWGVFNLGYNDVDQVPQGGSYTFRHNGKCTVLYLDGHVELELPANELNERKRWRWWDVGESGHPGG